MGSQLGVAELMRILTVNAGSSSLKLRVLDDSDEVTSTADLPALSGPADQAALAGTIGGFGPVDAVAEASRKRSR